MPPESQPSRPRNSVLAALGYALLLVCGLVALWFACGTIVPRGESLMAAYHMPSQPVLTLAFSMERPGLESIRWVTLAGNILLVVSLVGKGPEWMVAGSRAALGSLAGMVAALSMALLICGGVALIMGSTSQRDEMETYKVTLNHLGLLASAHDEFEKIQSEITLARGAKMVEVKSADEFSDEEARERLSLLILMANNSTDPAEKKRLLATVTLFRKKIQPYQEAHVMRLATEAGAPDAKTIAETLDWITANLNKDGWVPMPLFKITP